MTAGVEGLPPGVVAPAFGFTGSPPGYALEFVFKVFGSDVFAFAAVEGVGVSELACDRIDEKMEPKLPVALLLDTCVLDRELKPVLELAVEKIGMASMAEVTGCVPGNSSRPDASW